MSHNKYFQFKHFRVEQQNAAMKVNTDGVLLGAWINISNAQTILDIGTGTGVIALMSAQRSDAEVVGIEIDTPASTEAAENVRNSPWPERITIVNTSFQLFAEQAKRQFDVIVSNPPFFSNKVKNADQQLSIARHNHSLPFADIISGTLSLLSTNGKLSLILPVDESAVFINLAAESGLFLCRIARVKPFPDKEPNRFLMEFGRYECDPEETTFSVYDESKIHYSADFAKLAKEFYLKL